MTLIDPVLGHIRQNRYAYLVIAVALVLEIIIVTRPLAFLLGNVLPDDAFYYFQIARDIVHGVGSTFDGIHPTNGYHPLWLIVLLPIFALFSVGGIHDIAPVYAALGVSVALNGATMVMVLVLVSRITQNRLARAFSVALYALNPFVMYESLNGLESSLALFFLALFFLSALALERADRRAEYVRAGIIGGLLVLSRIDMAFYVAAVFCWIFLRHGAKEGLPRAVRFSVPVVLLVVPWFVYNLAGFHMLLTSSAGAASLVNHTLTMVNGTSFLAEAKAVLYMLVYYGRDAIVRTGAAWLMFVFVGAYLAFGSDDNTLLPRKLRDVSVFLALLGGFIALFLVDGGIRFTARSYYFISVDLFLAVWGAYLFKLFGKRKHQFRTIFAALFLATLAGFGIGWYATLRDQDANQVAMYDMAQWMNAHIPAGTPVGVFNAGIIGYFSDMRIVNLDGLVNDSAYEALKGKRIWSYLADEHIAYLSDFPIYITYRYRPFLGIDDPMAKLVPLQTFTNGQVHGTTGITFYQVEQ